MVFARPVPRGGFLSLDLGAYGVHVDLKMNARTGEKSTVGAVLGMARLRGGINLGKNFFIEPSVTGLIPWRSGNDGNTKIFTFQGEFNLSYFLFSFLKVKAGPGLYVLWLISSASTVSLNNGTSTSNFYLPGRQVVSFQHSVNGGFEFRLSKRFSLNLDTYVLNIGNKTKRSFNGSVSIGYLL